MKTDVSIQSYDNEEELPVWNKPKFIIINTTEEEFEDDVLLDLVSRRTQNLDLTPYDHIIFQNIYGKEICVVGITGE